MTTWQSTQGFLDDFRGGPASMRWRGAHSRSLFAIRAPLWRVATPLRIRESSPLTLVVSQLVWVWSLSRKGNSYNAKSTLLTIEWE